ncbi:MAG: hypothetical protein AB7T63_07525 [Planctomycetota bacterium]
MQARLPIRPGPRMLAALALLALAAPGAAPAHAEDGRPFHVVSGYLDEPVLGARRVEMEGFLGGNAILELDPNRCQLDEFGDPGVCTRMAARRLEVTLHRAKLADPRGHGRALYGIAGLPREGETSPGPKLFLVAPPAGSPDTWRLVVDGGDAGRRVVLLEARPPAPGGGAAPRPPAVDPEPEPGPQPLCSNVSYTARWADGQVTIEAQMDLPTPGYEVRFERSPLRIWPPQHQLICIPPDGLVIQVITPATVTTTFAAAEPPAEVIVRDRQGAHRVPVTTK